MHSKWICYTLAKYKRLIILLYDKVMCCSYYQNNLNEEQHHTHFLRTISEAPLLYMRKLPSDNLTTVLMDFLTELKV